MDAETAAWLVSPDARPALDLAESLPDPGSLASASRLRAILPPERAAAVAEQAVLRRRARAKVGDEASVLFWTTAGLEQATRPSVAGRRARRFAALGASDIVDVGCGLGLDARALAAAGLTVTGIERDPVTAVLARANLAPWPSACVLQGDAVELAPALLSPRAAVFVDPARRTSAGRSWRVEDFTPPWDFVLGLLDGSRPACAKLGPGLPYALIPDHVDAEWVSDHGEVVEAALWAGPGVETGRRTAVVDGRELSRGATLNPPAVGPVGRFVYEPDGAVIRAGLVPAVATLVDGHRLHDGVAYLTASGLVRTPWAEAFEVLETLPYKEVALRAWVRERRVGVLEIKKRGVDADPAALRRRLRPSGPNAATLILTPTGSGAVALVVERVRPLPPDPAAVREC